jgi:signal transduction histidine kinase
MRLTLLYASLFFVSGLALLAVALFLVFREPILATFKVGGPPVAPAGAPPTRATGFQPATLNVTPTWATLRAMFVQSLIGLAAMAAVSGGLGWIVAGRVLSPLRTITSVTRRISEQNLHERLALPGPRDELVELGDTIDDLLARLEAAFAARRRFVANASHELRTPLAMIRTSVDVAVGKPQPVPREVTVLAGKVYESLDLSEKLLEGLLLLARAQNREVAKGETVSLRRLAEEAVEKRSAAIEGSRLAAEVTGDAVEITGNGMLLVSLVENLVDNAVRHNQPDGWFRVTTQACSTGTMTGTGTGPRTRLVVESSGARLDQAAVDLLGQPFQRLGASRTAPIGTGLGLSIVSAVAEAHGGRLTLHARPDGGLRAEVEL